MAIKLRFRLLWDKSSLLFEILSYRSHSIRIDISRILVCFGRNKHHYWLLLVLQETMDEFLIPNVVIELDYLYYNYIFDYLL